MSALPTLHYWGIGGRAEPLRLALVLAGVPFTNKIYTFPEFGALKASNDPILKFGQFPILTLADGTVLAESNAILRYIGTQGSKRLYPADPVEAAKVDGFVGMLADAPIGISMTNYGSKFGLLAKDTKYSPEEVKAIRERIATDVLPPKFQMLEASINESGFLVGDSLTIADISLHYLVSWLQMGILDHVSADIAKGYPKIQALVKKINDDESVKKWYVAKGEGYTTADWNPEGK